MGRKNRKKKLHDPGKAEEFKVTPFAGLDVALPPELLSEKTPESVSESEPEPEASSQLPLADRDLLRVFGDGQTVEHGPKAPLTTIGIERKGRGGKTITWVRGLDGMELLDQMEFARSAAKSLGAGCRFQEGVMEVQGDQRQRLAAWLEANAFRVRIV